MGLCLGSSVGCPPKTALLACAWREAVFHSGTALGVFATSVKVHERVASCSATALEAESEEGGGGAFEGSRAFCIGLLAVAIIPWTGAEF